MSRENSFSTTDGQFIEELRTIESSNNGTIESSSTFSKDFSQTQTTSLRQIVLSSTESFQKIQNVRFAFNPKHYEKFYDCTVELKENTEDKSLIYYTDKETGEIKSFSTKESWLICQLSKYGANLHRIIRFVIHNTFEFISKSSWVENGVYQIFI
ncbi:uncharacterized protein LOC130662661 [Hydractinia symbiolongicarpus]|uniref:uncharacterized protein LOC130662661 n=1 Tax=Hydractinia symbiolongicarpus TaxID=13093 RepID=UPI00254C41C7|nr:uncharacterized protein LOC130662661 [Hydractinia symbiolongicarpus]